MEDYEIQEQVQRVAQQHGFEVKEVTHLDETTIYLDQTTEIDDTRALLLAAVLFDQIGSKFDTIAVNQWGAEGEPKQYAREQVQDAMEKFVEVFNSLPDKEL
jgi:hypothetical protein